MKAKFFSLMFALVAICTTANAETVTLSFSGETTEGRYCLLDSVRIENLTQNWVQTLDCSNDTTFELALTQTPTGIDNIPVSNEKNGLLSVSQNFMIGTTSVTINPLTDGIIHMRVLDMMGRIVIEHVEYLNAGYHQYALQLGSAQTYILSVVTDTEYATAKILNMSSFGNFDLARISSIPAINQAPARRQTSAEGGDLMQYTGYTNQKGVAVASEPVTQTQRSPEHIVLRFVPVVKSAEGMYVSMMGFNNALYTYPFDILTTSNLYTHQQFVSNLSMASGTILYHAVYTSLDNIIKAPVPEKLQNVSIVTFTDGLDVNSWRMNNSYPSEALYLAAVNNQIHRTYIDGIKLGAYAIGVKGSDVTDEVRFENDLHQLASDSANVFNVLNMEEVNARFREIAAKIYNTKVNYSLTIKLAAPEPGSVIRFTFDNVNDANNSIYFIEGTYDFDWNTYVGTLNNVNYSGVQCTNGTAWVATSQGIFDIFTIYNLSSNLGERISTTHMKQWIYVPSSDMWQINSEFDASSSAETTEERTSAIVALVLDCSSSLGNYGFSKLKSAANNFLNILTGNGDISKPSISIASYKLGDLQATLSANITNTGNLQIIDKGFCVSENPNMNDAVFYSCGAGTDNFEYLLTGLTDNKTYYIRPYAENQLGRTYGNTSSFSAVAATPPTVQTFEISHITTNSAECGGKVISANYAEIIEQGICWSLNIDPTIEDSVIVFSSGLSSFSGIMENLEDGTTYYVRAYAINSRGVGYGEEKSFTTIEIVTPTITTSSITNITINSAICGGNVTSDGNSDVIERGICWSKSPDPTTEDSVIILGSGLGSYNGSIENLEDGSTYYVRAYAKNKKQIGYGEEKSFTTIAIIPPTLTAIEITDITYSSAVCRGEITSEGNTAVIERGICWGIKQNPTIEDNILVLGSGIGSFSGTVNNLLDETTYYIRAYAKNQKGVVYGEENSFKTITALPIVSLSSVSVTSSNSATCIGEVVSEGKFPIIERGFCWGTNPNPTKEDNYAIVNSESGIFTGTITNIENSKDYYIRAYAINTNNSIVYNSESDNKKIYIDIISYTANSKLPEVTDGVIKGLRPDSFNVHIVAHEFSDGTGIIAFSGKLTTIGGFAFMSCQDMTSITIPKYVTNIDHSAFYQCTNLLSANIPDGVTNIGAYAFESCYSLTSISIPNSVTYIGNRAFMSCYSLTSITIPNTVSSIGADAFLDVPNIVYYGISTGSPWGAKCMNGYIKDCLVYEDENMTKLMACSRVAVDVITIPNSVNTIKQRAFRGCRSIISVIIPNSVTSIENGVFYGCSNLTSLTIPNSIKSIGESAFYGCSSLKSIHIPNNITSIGKNAFQCCYELTSIIIGNSVTSIGEYAFDSCTKLSSVTNRSTTPQNINSNVFSQVRLSTCKLYVPSSSVTTYKSKNVWKSFGTILQISE